MNTARPRGPSGSVRGMTEHDATELLVKAVAGLPRPFQRADAAIRLRGLGVDSDDAVDGLLQAIRRMPGTRVVGRGLYLLPPNAEEWIRARMWRFAAPRIDAATAVLLLALLEENRHQ